MRILFLTANQAWVVVLGESIIDLDDERFFESLSDLKFMLRCKGLTVRRGKVVPIGHPFGDK